MPPGTHTWKSSLRDSISTCSTLARIESLRLGFLFWKPSLRDSILAWWYSIKIESLRLGYQKGKPSLKDSIFKVVTSHQSVPGHFPHQSAGWVVKSVRCGSVKIANIFSLSHVI